MQVTDTASKLLDRIQRPEGKVLRLQPGGQDGRLGLVFGVSHEDDIVIRRPGHQPLHVPAYLRSKFANAVLDGVDTPSGPSLAIRHPG